VIVVKNVTVGSVLVEPLNGGLACPSLSESQSCNTHACETYSWYTFDWGKCSKECGSGLQTRVVECRSDLDNLVVDDSFCSDSKPSESQICNLNLCSSEVSLNFDKVSPQEYETIVTPSCFLVEGDGVAKLKLNDVEIESDESLKLAVGNNEFLCYTDETSSFSYSQESLNFSIYKKTPTLVLNSSLGWLVQSNGNVTIEGFDCPEELTCNLFKNGVLVSNPYNVSEDGVYNFVFNTTGNNNYNSYSVSNTLEITSKQIPSLSFTPVDGSDFDYLDGYTISCTTDSDGDLKVYRDGIEVVIGVSENLTAGNYEYVCNVTGTGNYVSKEIINTITVNKINPLVDFTNSRSLWNFIYDANPVEISFSESNTGDSDVDYFLYKDGVKNSSFFVTNAGTYNFLINSTVGQNYFGSTNLLSNTLTISPKIVDVSADANSKTYGFEDPALNFTSSGLLGGDAISGSLSRETGESAGTYNILQGSLDAGSNYNINFNGAIFTIDKNSSVCDVLFNETSGLNYSKKFEVFSNCNSDFELFRNGTLVSENVQNLSAGVYNFSVVRLDDVNYTNVYDEKEFVVNKIKPNFEVLFNSSLIENNSVQEILESSEFNLSVLSEVDFEIRRDGTNVTLENGTFIDLNFGSYEYVINIFENENYISEKFVFNLEVEREFFPEITSLSFNETSIYTNSIFEINFSYVNTSADNYKYRLYVNGGFIEEVLDSNLVNQNTNWAKNDNLTISVQVCDSVCSGWVNHSVIVEDSLPELIINYFGWDDGVSLSGEVNITANFSLYDFDGDNYNYFVEICLVENNSGCYSLDSHDNLYTVLGYNQNDTLWRIFPDVTPDYFYEINLSIYEYSNGTNISNRVWIVENFTVPNRAPIINQIDISVGEEFVSYVKNTNITFLNYNKINITAYVEAPVKIKSYDYDSDYMDTSTVYFVDSQNGSLMKEYNNPNYRDFNYEAVGNYTITIFANDTYGKKNENITIYLEVVDGRRVPTISCSNQNISDGWENVGMFMCSCSNNYISKNETIKLSDMSSNVWNEFNMSVSVKDIISFSAGSYNDDYETNPFNKVSDTSYQWFPLWNDTNKTFTFDVTCQTPKGVVSEEVVVNVSEGDYDFWDSRFSAIDLTNVTGDGVNTTYLSGLWNLTNYTTILGKSDINIMRSFLGTRDLSLLITPFAQNLWNETEIVKTGFSDNKTFSNLLNVTIDTLMSNYNSMIVLDKTAIVNDPQEWDNEFGFNCTYSNLENCKNGTGQFNGYTNDYYVKIKKLK